MSKPTVNVIINFSTGAGFGNPFILDQSKLGSLDVLADATALIVDVSNQVDSVSTSRGRQDLQPFASLTRMVTLTHRTHLALITPISIPCARLLLLQPTWE
jgi:hypothetical protein